MLALETLVWNSDTSALEQAVKKIDNLTTAVQRLSKAQQDEIKTAVQSEKLKQEEAKTATANAKAKEAEAKAEQTLAKSKQVSAKATKEVTENTDASNKVLQRQKEMLEFMTQGYSRGQASTLAYAKATGAATSELTELGNVLKTQRKLIGSEPFDRSLSGLIALKNQLGEVREAYRQYGDGVELTRNQTRELARDKERIIERLKQEGASFTDIKNAIRSHGEEYITTAARVNSLINQEKELERQHRESANAVRALAAEEERMSSIMQSMNEGMNQNVSASERSALSIARYERNLRLAGVGAEEAARKLAVYKAQMMQVQEIEQNRRAQHLSRALTPQISDVVTSIAGGMPLHLVIMQQGLQIRDMITLSGVEMNKLQEVFRTASADMVRSLTGTAQAIGTLLIGSIISLGNTIKDGLIAPFKVAGQVMKEFPGVLQGNAQSIQNVEQSFGNFRVAIGSMAKVLAGAGVAALTAFTIAAFQVISASSQMSSSLIQFGASLGVTFQEAKALASGLTDMGVTYGTALQNVGAFAKSGITNLSTLKTALEAATGASGALGIKVEDIVSKYSEIGKKPVETLIEIAKQTGLVDSETIRLVDSLLRQGKEQEAVTLAQDAYSESLVRMKSMAEQNMTPIEKLWKDIKTAFSEAWGVIQEAADNIDLFDGMRKVFARIKLEIAAAFGYMKGLVVGIAEIAQGNFDMTPVVGFVQEEHRKALEDYNTTMKDIEGTVERTIKQQKEEAEERKKNVESVKGLEDQLKREKETRKEALKESQKVQDFYNKSIEDFQKMQVKSSGTTDDLSKAQVHLLNVMNDPKWEKISVRQKEQILSEMAKAHAAEITAKEYEKQEKALEKLLDLYQSFDSDLLDIQTSITEANKELEFQYSIIGKTDDEVKQMTRSYNEQKNIAKILTEQQKLQLKYLQDYAQVAAGISDPAELEKMAEELNNRILQLGIKTEEQIANARKQSNLEVMQDYEKKFKEVQETISEAIWLGMTEGGKSGADYLKKYLETQFKNYVINVLINPIIGNLMGGAAGSSGGISGMFQGGNIIGNLQSAWSAFSGGLVSSVSGAIGTLGSAFGSSAVSSFASGMGMTASQIGGLSQAGLLQGGAASLGASFASVLPWVGGALAIGNLLGAFKGPTYHTGAATFTDVAGTQTTLKHKQTVPDTRVWGGFTEVDAKGGKEFVDTLNSLAKTGTNIVENTLAMFGKSQQVQAFAAFGADKNDPSRGNFRIYDAAGNLLSSTSGDVMRGQKFNKDPQKGFTEFAAATANVVKDALISADLPAWVDDILSSVGEVTFESLQAVLDDISYLSGELTSSQDKVAGAIRQIFSEFTNLGLSMPSTIEGFKSLIENSGNLGFELYKLAPAFINLINAQQQVYEQLYTEEERFANSSEALLKSFQELGVALPKSKQDFRGLIDSIDLTTEAGVVLKAQLLDLVPAFVEFADRAREVSETMLNSARSSVDSAFAALQNSVNREKEVIQSRIDALKPQIDTLKKVFTILGDSINKLFNASPAVRAMKFKSAMDLISGSASTGVLPSSDVLEEAVSVAMQGVENGLYATAADQERARILLANDLGKLKDNAGGQLSELERILKVNEQELAKLDKILQKAQQQIDALRGNTGLSVSDAVKNLELALVKELQNLAAVILTSLQSLAISPQSAIEQLRAAGVNITPESWSSVQTSGGTQNIWASTGGAAALGSTIYAKDGTKFSISEAASFINKQLNAGDPLSIYSEAVKKGISSSSLDALMGWETGESLSWAKQQGLPAFASGGAFTNGVVSEPTLFNTGLMGESGSEAILPLTSVGGSLGVHAVMPDMKEVVQELKTLRAEVVMLRAETRATVSNTSKTAKLLDRVVPDGQSVQVTVV